MALTAHREYETKGPTIRIGGKSAASTTWYKGSLVVLDAGGNYAAPTDGAALIPAGILTGFGFDKSGVALSAGVTTDIEVEKGLIWVPFATAAQTDVGELFYLADNADVTKTAGAKTYGLICREFRTGLVLLDFSAPVKVA